MPRSLSLYLFLFLSLCLAACTGATASPTPGSGEAEWIELDPEAIVIDDLGSLSEAEPAILTLAEAQQDLPFSLDLPAWVPEGFSLLDEVEVVEADDYASATLTWQNAEQDSLYLQITSAPPEQTSLGGGGDVQTVTVGGEPALLVTGSRLGQQRLDLTWGRLGLRYTLSADGGATADDLVRMAESVG